MWLHIEMGWGTSYTIHVNKFCWCLQLSIIGFNTKLTTSLVNARHFIVIFIDCLSGNTVEMYVYLLTDYS